MEMPEEARKNGKQACRASCKFLSFERDSALYSSMCMLTSVSVVLKRAEISVKSCTRVK